MKWHQDIQFWPHTNYDLLTIGVFLEDVEPGMGEVGFVPGSHDGPLFDLYDGDRWVGALGDGDVARAGVERAEYPTGPAGSITVHHCRTVHGSATNRSDRPRPLLLQTYAAADALSYTDLVRRSPHGEELIRGNPPRWARHDPRPCLIPPSGPYRPIFAAATARGLTLRSRTRRARSGVQDVHRNRRWLKPTAGLVDSGLMTLTAVAGLQHAGSALGPDEAYLAAMRIGDPDIGRPTRDPLVGLALGGLAAARDQTLTLETAIITVPVTGAIVGVTAGRVPCSRSGCGSARPSCSARQIGRASPSTPSTSGPRSSIGSASVCSPTASCSSMHRSARRTPTCLRSSP